MPLPLVIALIAPPAYTPPQPWALNLAPAPVIPLVGDVDGDGFADIVTVNPKGDCEIGVTRTVEGVKPALPFTAIRKWGKDCLAVVIGDFDGQKGKDVAGLFDGTEIRLAKGLAKGAFTDAPKWATLPKPIPDARLSLIERGKAILVFSPKTADAYRIVIATGRVEATKVLRGLDWVGEIAPNLAAADAKGEVSQWDGELKIRGKVIGRSKSNRLATDGSMLLIGDQVLADGAAQALPPSPLSSEKSIFEFGDVDGDGDGDLFEFRRGIERHTGGQVLLRRAIGKRETDTDHDGISDIDEKALGTDPLNPDSDNDGLLDVWEIGSYRGLDFKSIGCDPMRADTICLISPFEDIDEARMKSELERVRKTYDELDFPNPGGRKGIGFHPIYLSKVSGEDMTKPWWENREKNRPEKWRGIVHWMQVTRGGGGQADELGDGGTVGTNDLWAVFLHEFGHQLGLDHSGFWPGGGPIYSSLMNYNYSYGFEDDHDKIHYSQGPLAKFEMKETDLDETLPLPYDQVKFLEKAPYRFRLKPNGNTTLIDWNWNGVFGEKHVRADINYAYSTHAGLRDDLGKAKTAPFIVVAGERVYTLFGTNDKPLDKKSDPSLSKENPGRLVLRQMVKPYQWKAPFVIEKEGVVGDPVSIPFGKGLAVAYPTLTGVWLRVVDSVKGEVGSPVKLSDDPTQVPTLAVHTGTPWLFLWSPKTGEVTYQPLVANGNPGRKQLLSVKSTNPVGLCSDSKTGEVIVGLAQDQDEKRPHRWQIRRYRVEYGRFVEKSTEWIEGPDGAARGKGRITLLFDGSKDAGPQGRVYFYCLGMTTLESPWSCAYVGQQLADKSVRGGWLVKRYYDEWSQSRSAPAAAWYKGDILYAYRWVDGAQGETDNNLHLGYQGLGIHGEPMGDFDDLTFFRSFGLRHSLLYLGKGD